MGLCSKIELMGPQSPQGEQPKLPIPGVKNLIAVGSGKGGVGKTTVSVNLAISLTRLGHSVGLLDADVYGPNVPLMMGVRAAPSAIGERIQPIEKNGVRIMSMGFLNPGDKPLVWRGPMLHSVIQQFLRGVDWGELDYLIIDLPPGTGDVQLTLIQTAPLTGAVVVTTPSDSRIGGKHELPGVPALQGAHRRLQLRRWKENRRDHERAFPGRAAARSRGSHRRRFGQSHHVRKQCRGLHRDRQGSGAASD
jgi:NUBPL iron-transfer P-loop NTPase